MGGSLNKARKTDILFSSHWFFFNENLKKEFENVDENFEIFRMHTKKVAENFIIKIVLGGRQFE